MNIGSKVMILHDIEYTDYIIPAGSTGIIDYIQKGVLTNSNLYCITMDDYNTGFIFRKKQIKEI